MATATLTDFLDELESAGELARVKAQVSPVLEIAAITDRVCKTPAPHGHKERDKSAAASLGGKALLFENVAGAEMPVAINTFGSYWRINKALGTDTLDALAERVQQLVKPEIPTTLIEKMKRIPDLMKMASYPPKSVRSGICQQVVYEGDRADLTRLPVIQCWPFDGDLSSGQVFDPAAAATASPRGTGRYITLGGIHSINPETGDRNIGMYRVQLFGPRLAAMHWHPHHDGARHYRAYQRRGEKMPVAIVLGGESVLPYAATAPLPPGVEELLFAGFLNGRGIELVPCKTVPLEVPANAEIVIEGFVDPQQKLMEGPFGDHTGFYSMADWFPALHVTAITTRKNPIYPTTVVGKPPMEDYFLGKATERVFLPLLKMLVPDIADYCLPISGVFHNCAFISIRKEYPQQARRVMHAIWGAGQMAFTKFIVVVDQTVDVHDEQAVLFHLFANCDPLRDVEIVKGPVDILDHAAIDLGAGGKIGFDATIKLPGEGKTRPWPAELDFDGRDEVAGGSEMAGIRGRGVGYDERAIAMHRPWYQSIVEANDSDTFYKCFDATTPTDRDPDTSYEKWYGPLERLIVDTTLSFGIPAEARELFDDWCPNCSRHVTIEMRYMSSRLIAVVHDLLGGDYLRWRIEITVVETIEDGRWLGKLALWSDWALCWGNARSMLPSSDE